MMDSSPNLPRQSSSFPPARLYVIPLSFLISLFLLIPYFMWGTASGHDFDFHVASWLDVAYQWKQGVLFPRWTVWTNHGFGEPRFIFYPPLSWLFGAALTSLLPGPWVPLTFIVLTQTLAGFSSFTLLRRLVSERAALFGALCYAVNPYALLISYIRSDFAEQLACAIFPFVLLGALRVSHLLKDNRTPQSAISLFAIPFAAVWLCNAPAGVIVTYSCALLFAFGTLSQRSWKIAVHSAAGFLLGFGLAGFYLIPAAFEQRWVNIAQALSSGLLPWQNFLFTQIEDVEHTWFNWIASICALAVILLFAAAALASRRFAPATDKNPAAQSAWNALLLLGATATLLMMRITLPLWNHLPELRFVQFPWRWMSILALIACCFLAAAFQKLRWPWPLIVLAITLPLAFLFVNNTWWDFDEMSAQNAAIISGTGFDGTDEYDPVGDDHMDLPANAPPAKILAAAPDGPPPPPSDIQIEKWTSEQKIIRIQSSAPARVALRVLNYPAWQVTRNGQPLTPDRLEDINQMVVPIRAGASLIEVKLHRTTDRTAGALLSLLSALTAVVLLAFHKKTNPTSDHKLANLS